MLSTLLALAVSATVQRPNIVFIMSDDHAAHAISAYGSRVNRTPNIDRLAKEGMLLRNVFATNSICTPSRATILTGQYSHVNGVTVFNRFDSSRLTVARLLQQSGYYTGMIGKWKYQRYMQDYLATVQSVDDNVGRVMDFLDTNGLARNTIVIYTSDQGFFLGDHGLFDKRFMYEESLRMPFLIRWPAVIEAGSRSDAMALNVDFAETFLEAAGLPVPDTMQGRSLVPVLRGRVPADWRTSMYYRYYHDPGDHNTRAHYGVRTRTHKLICFWKKDEWELFDLVNDPLEMNNIYGQPGHEKITATLKAELLRLKQAVRDEDQLANEQLPNGVDGPVAKLRGK